MERKRILIKISGEYLGKEDAVFDKERISEVADIIISVFEKGNSVFLVMGGGNICRGKELANFNFPNGGADMVGMISTVQNAIILKNVLDSKGAKAHAVCPFAWGETQIKQYDPGKAAWWADEERHIVVFGGGLGRRGFTTDMAALSRAYEVGASVVVKVTEVGGIFTADPKKDASATLIPSMTFEEAVKGQYAVMDDEAFVFAKNKKIPIKVCNLDDLRKENIFDKEFGTLVS